MSDTRRKRYSGGVKPRSTENGDQSHGNHHRPKATQATRPKTLTHSANKMSGFDHVRKIVQEEGRTARNLVQYSVPLSENSLENRTMVSASLTNPSRRPNSTTRSHSHVTPPPGSRYRHRSSSEMGKSPRSDAGSKKNDLRARYWKYMFDNFQRAVDAIYQTCEQDESVVECKEVIMMLEQSTKDFKALIETLNMMKAYEDSAKEGDRPSAVAWEVRKMSPNKHGPSSPGPGYTSVQVKSNLERSGHSWADKVRGARAIDFNSSQSQTSVNITGAKTRSPNKSVDEKLPSPNVNVKQEAVSIEDTLEDEGWERVQRGRVRARQSPSQKSTENLAAAPTSSAKRNLMRSLSSPDHGKATKTPPKAQQSISEKDLSTPLDEREKGKSDSKSNEKESVSSNGQKVVNNVHITQSGDSDNDVLSVIVDDSLNTSIATTPGIDSPLLLSRKDSLELQLQNDIDRALDEEIQLSSELEMAQRKALAYAEQEEESWLKELAREQNSQVEYIEAVNDLATTNSSVGSSSIAITDWESLEAAHEEEMSQMKSWGDLVTEADELRTPGHGVHMHEKLSSPSRKRSPTESRRRHEEKQAKAQELREKLMQEKAERLRDLSKKVAEVRTYKEELMRQGKTLLKHKLERAEEKRQSQLKLKARKAHEEEAKANEIAFINSLEAQNKRHEIMSKYQESDARLQEIAEERQRRLEEKQAKEAAVEERRKALEADRKARLISMQERRKQRDARIEFQQQEKEKERREAVRVKGREREERIAALNAQQEAQKQELQKKIQQKQDETNQRHEEILQQIRGRAFEMSVMKHSTEDHNDAPKLTPYDHNKICVICNTLISSEVYLLSHLRGKKHQQALKDHNSGMEMRKEEIENFNLKHIIDVPENSNHPKIVTEKERIKSLKKRCKKLRNRMVSRGQEYESVVSNKQMLADSDHKAKFQKVIKDLNKYLQAKETGPWPQNKVSALDRALGELGRILDKKNAVDQASFRILGGFAVLSRLLLTIDDITSSRPCVIPPKSLCLICDVFKYACKNHFENCHYVLFTNKIGALVDHLIVKMNILIPDSLSKPNSLSLYGTSTYSTADGGSNNSGDCSLPFDAVCCSMMQVLNTVLSCLSKHNPASNCSEASSERMTISGDALTTRGNDIVSYIISVGVMDKLRIYLSAVRGPVDGDKNTSDFLLHSLGLLLAITKFVSKRNVNMFDKKRPTDPTQLISTFEVTELVGIVSLLYGLLLHSGAPARSSESVPKELTPPTLSIIVTGLRLLNHLALLDLEMFQSTLGEEGLSLEFRHITSYLMWYCGHVSAEELMHEVILCVGYFTVLHADNQVIIQSGQPPTVLQQMCALPFAYFSDPRLVSVLFPTLIACCYNNNCNKDILEQELSCALLSNYIEERFLESQQAKLLPSTVKKSKSIQDSKDGRDSETRMAFSLRFPSNRWEQCQKYFSSEEPSSDS